MGLRLRAGRRRALIRTLLLSALLAGCQFDDSAYTELRPCSSQVDCTSPLSPFCVGGRCVGSEAADVGEGEGEAGDGGAGLGGEDGAGEGEGEGEGLPPGDPPVAVAQAPAHAWLGDRVLVSGAQSVGRGLTYQWTITGPDEGAVDAHAGDAPSEATFIALRRGVYQVSLRVADDVHRTDIGQQVEVNVAGFDALDRALDARDIEVAPDGEAAWIATEEGAARVRLTEPPEDEPDAGRQWAWTDYDGGGQGSDKAIVGPHSAWLARTGSGALRVKRVHDEDDPRPATPQALPGVGRVRALAVGPQRRVWFGGDDGLRRTLGNEGGSLGPPLELPGDRSVIALHAGADGLWIGRAGGVCLAPWTDDADLACSREISMIDGVDHLLTALAEDGAGDLWIATDGQGLYRVAADDSVEVFAPGARGLPAGRTDDLHPDPSGDLWLVAGGQLMRLYRGVGEEAARIEAFETASGLAVVGEIQAVSVASGEDADVWISAVRGVARLDR